MTQSLVAHLAQNLKPKTHHSIPLHSRLTPMQRPEPTCKHLWPASYVAPLLTPASSQFAHTYSLLSLAHTPLPRPTPHHLHSHPTLLWSPPITINSLHTHLEDHHHHLSMRKDKSNSWPFRKGHETRKKGKIRSKYF